MVSRLLQIEFDERWVYRLCELVFFQFIVILDHYFPDFAPISLSKSITDLGQGHLTNVSLWPDP
jgi:hypothetical protein